MPDKMELHFSPITSLSSQIRKGDLSPVELTEHCLSRIERLDPYLHAFISVNPEKAKAMARAAEMEIRAGNYMGPLHGIPFAVKDLFDVKGLPTTAGTHRLKKNIAKKNSYAVQRLIEAGMILLGKTHTVQFAYSGIGINHDLGTPHNPWKKEHYIPGGSSSGSAVAVSSGMVPMALGTDTGGSVRIPASLCGITGLKTTVGRISRQGVYPLSQSMDSVGPITRNAEDAALIYQCLHGMDPDDRTTIGTPLQNVFDTLKSNIKGLRLAVPDSIFFDEIDPEIKKVVMQASKIFTDLGAHVVSIEFPEAEMARELNRNGLIIAAEAYAVNKDLLENHFDDLDHVVASRMINGKKISAAEYIMNKNEWEKLRIQTEVRLRDTDALLVPTTPIPALPVGEIDRDMDTYLKKNNAYLKNTSIGNILNLCGLTVPCGLTGNGLPVGMMIYGKPFHEDIVLRSGYAFQKETQWHTQTPDIEWIS